MNLENVWYAYNAGGHCKRIVKNYPGGEQGLPDPADWFVTDLEYDLNQHLWLVRKFTCGRDEQTGAIEDAVLTMVREFRYDSDRGRYLTRERSTDPAKFFKPVGDRWTEYLGDEPYRDFEVDVTEDPCQPSGYAATPVPTRRYIRGYGLVATEDDQGNMQFIHGDLLGSTRLMTEGSDAQTLGAPTARGEYLAFGQVIDLSSLVASGIAPTPNIRYGWCGSWGYESDALESGTLGDEELDLALLHIGARYYSPEIGRWVQRDPVGIGGGLNAYVYAYGCPGHICDRSGKYALAVTAGAGINLNLQVMFYPAVAVGALLTTSIIANITADYLATYSRTTSVGAAADALGLPAELVRKAIHTIKNQPFGDGNPDVEIDTETGDVFVEGTEELIGNILDELEDLGCMPD